MRPTEEADEGIRLAVNRRELHNLIRKVIQCKRELDALKRTGVGTGGPSKNNAYVIYKTE